MFSAVVALFCFSFAKERKLMIVVVAVVVALHAGF